MNNKDIKAKDAPKAISENNFSTVYSLTNGGSQDQGPFITPNTTVLNLYDTLPNKVNVELLARNRSKNGNFTDNLQVDGGDIIEFKLSITNTSTTNTLYSVETTIYQSNLLSWPGMLATFEGGAIMGGLGRLTFRYLYLPPMATAIATYVYVAVGNGNVSFPGYTDVQAQISGEIRRFYFNKLPYLSIINALNLSSTASIINYSKYVRLIQPSLNNSFGSSSLDVINGDIIEFELYIKNTDSNKTNVYNLKLVDKLNNNLSYIEGSLKGTYIDGNLTSYNTIWGNADFNSTNATTINGKLVGGSIEWTMSVLDNDSVNSTNAYQAYLYFQCEVVE